MTVWRTTGSLDLAGVFRRNPAFARMYGAQLVSFAGDWFATVALQGLLLELTGNATLSGLMLTMQILPTAVMSPVAGVIVDRFDRRIVMIGCDVVRAVLALGLLFVRTPETLWIAFAVIAVMATVSAFFDPASSAALPNLVRPDDLPGANVLVGSAWGTMLAVGAMLGGIVAATFGRDAAFIGDSVSFVVSAILLLSIRSRFQAEDARREGRITIVADIVEMLRFARSEPRVLSLLLVKGGFGIAGGVIALVAVMAEEVFRAGDTGIGIIMSGRGVGALIGPLLFRRLFGTSDRAIFRAISWSFVVFGFGYALFGVSPGLWVAAGGALVAHLGGGAQWTMSSLGLQRFTPDRIRGRVFAADYTLVFLTIGLSIFGAGALADRFGVRPVALGLSVVAFAWSGTWTLATRRFWPHSTPVPRETTLEE